MILDTTRRGWNGHFNRLGAGLGYRWKWFGAMLRSFWWMGTLREAYRFGGSLVWATNTGRYQTKHGPRTLRTLTVAVQLSIGRAVLVVEQMFLLGPYTHIDELAAEVPPPAERTYDSLAQGE